MSATEEMMKKLHLKLTERMIETLEGEELSPQMMNAIVSFLKSNDITCEKGASDSMSELQKKLEERRAKRSVKRAELTPQERTAVIDAAERFGGN